MRAFFHIAALSDAFSTHTVNIIYSRCLSTMRVNLINFIIIVILFRLLSTIFPVNESCAKTYRSFIVTF